MIFDDKKKHGQLVLSKEYSQKLYVSSNLAYITAFTAICYGYFLNYWIWIYTGITSTMYWKDPRYGTRRNLDIFMVLFNISTHFAMVYYDQYKCISYYNPTFFFYMGTSSYINALLFGRFFKRDDISSSFHFFFHLFMNASAISLYIC